MEKAMSDRDSTWEVEDMEHNLLYVDAPTEIDAVKQFAMAHGTYYGEGDHSDTIMVTLDFKGIGRNWYAATINGELVDHYSISRCDDGDVREEDAPGTEEVRSPAPGV